ncbi:DUF47 domain-containing protein [Mucilaginibacter sp. KACC 22063]|uniref:DUF47 domain-containing protein n=1 Tax=Mucilaginibacter sp. KACC 22063 TaxID=3025666 RepID=UPI002366899B|nr:DUF47 family protein [Mucilaginibacter sp. KACC 22063]WDF55188.1 DUF47 family protein [Mucilaginibacter sp. KACC 22063]
MKASMFGNFLPNHNKVFYNLFNQGATNTYEMASILYRITSAENMQDEKLNFNHISRLKDQADSIKHQVYFLSGKAFISPFSRDDMYALASAISSVSDYIGISARRLNFYGAQAHQDVKELSGIIVDCCHLLVDCVKALNDLSQVDKITEYCRRIKQTEHYADAVYRKAQALLVDKELDALEVIKFSDIFAVLEKSTDKCEHVVNVVESIIIKNS